MAFHGRPFNQLFQTSLFYKLDKFCDAVVIAKDGVEFKVHKLFLSKGSEYFHAFFRSNAGEEKDTVTLEFERNVLENILIFLYTGEIYMDAKNIDKLIIAADYLLIDGLLTCCRRFVLQEISFDCCIPLLIASYFVERLRTTRHCYRFVQVHFGELVHKCEPDIPKLPLRVFIDLLNDESLGVRDEDRVWKAIVIWVNGNVTERLENVSELLSCLRWSAVNHCLRSCIAIHPIFKDNEFCRSTDLDKLMGASKDEGQECNPLTGRCPSKMYVFICRKRSRTSDGVLEVFLTYDGEIDMWRKIGEADINFHKLIAVGGSVFMFNTFSNSMKAFDLLKKKWHQKNKIRTSRQGYFVVRDQKLIFAVGGFILMSNTKLSEVEYYDPVTDNWSYTKPIPSTIIISGASVVNDKLYVIGYIETPEVLEMKAFVYDKLHDAWSDIGKPTKFRTNFALINFRERLHIFGGQTEEFTSTTEAEVYCPEEDEWKTFPALPFPYQQPRAVTLKDKLMVYEDCPGIMSIPRFSPCMWNEEIQLWEVEDIISPFNEIYQYQFCCVDDRCVLQELANENRDPATIWSKTPFTLF